MKTRAVLWAILGITFVGVTGAFLRQSWRNGSRDSLPRLGRVSDFHFTNQNGQPIARRHLSGKTWVVDFIYTTCPDQCPRMTQSMRHLQDLIPREANVGFASVSVDPHRDTPGALKRYAQKFQADPGRWIFLTGDEKQVKQLMDDLKLGGPSLNGETNVIDHSSRLVLIDQRGEIRGYYDGTRDEDMNRLLRDLGRLAPAA
jgi:protein SCO1